jgi:hypothetical protein
MFAFTRALKALCPFLLLILAAGPVPAQQADEPQPARRVVAEAFSTPSLTARAAGVNSAAAERKLQLDLLEIRVRSRGTIAETTVTARFANPGHEQLEGDFRLAMPAGSVVTGYALDIGERMVPGVLVDQYQARIAYERLVRGRIDPGLAEVGRDNLFRTRVFPIPPRGTRTIRLSFVTPFDPARGYVLPLRNTGEIGRLALDVAVDGEPGNVQVPGAPDIRWQTQEGSSRFSLERQRAALDSDLVIAAPRQATGLTVSRHGNGDRFFEIRDFAVGGRDGPAPPPGTLTLLWDRSLSRADDGLEAEIALARQYVEQARPRAIELVLFDSAGVERVRVPSAEALVQRLRAVRYRGATSYQVLAGARLDGICLLFSDGLVTIDRREGFRPGCTLFALSSAADADRTWLGAIARQTGGEAFDLGTRRAEAVLGRLTRRVPRVLDVRSAAGDSVEYSLLGSAENGWRIVGPMPRGGDEIVVRLSGLPEGAGTRRYRPSRPDGAGDGAGALWASEQVALLAASDARSRDDIVAFSRRFSVASPDVSFIVLENGRDYAEAGIEPPADVPEGWQEQYRATRQQIAARETQAREGRLTQILAQWREMLQWRDARFTPRPRQRSGIREDEGRPIGPPPVLPAPMAPPPPSPEASGSEDIVVTSTRRPGARANEQDQAVAVTGTRIPRPNLESVTPVTVVAGEAVGQDEGNARGQVARTGTTELEPWKPNRPYLQALEAAPPAQRERVFAEQQREHGQLPAFWLDVSDWAWRNGRREDAIAWVLSALELPTRNNQTLAIVADRLLRYGETDRAIWLLERLLAAEDDRPQPRRTLALALARRARTAPPAQARADLQRAVTLLIEVVMTPWNNAYDGIEMISLVEANALIPRLRALGGSTPGLDPRLIALIDVDLRVTIEWQTEASDVDLWVDEPNGERVIFSAPRSSGGGRLSNDMTQGYGPEEYLMRRAPPGRYEIRANVFAADRLNPNGAQRVVARIFRDFGRATEREEIVDIEMMPDEQERERRVGTVTLGRR